jgi:hypothetical protein
VAERIGSIENPMTSSGFDPMTFWLVQFLSNTSLKHYKLSKLAQFMATEDVVEKYYKV